MAHIYIYIYISTSEGEMSETIYTYTIVSDISPPEVGMACIQHLTSHPQRSVWRIMYNIMCLVAFLFTGVHVKLI